MKSRGIGDLNRNSLRNFDPWAQVLHAGNMYCMLVSQIDWTRLSLTKGLGWQSPLFLHPPGLASADSI